MVEREGTRERGEGGRGDLTAALRLGEGKNDVV